MPDLTLLRQTVAAYRPDCDQEAQDRLLMLDFLDRYPDCLLRENRLAHFTASSWVLDESGRQTVMVYHNLYRSWSWTGGHADGDPDLLAVAQKEVREETGLEKLVPLLTAPLSLEVIPVDGHRKRGQYVSSHLHLNLTYLLAAPAGQTLRVCPAENRAVQWVDRETAPEISTEPWIADIYRKLNRKTDAFLADR